MKILVIDDNVHHSELARIRLEKEGWQVDCSTDPRPRPELGLYDFVLLDYHMPGGSGLETLQQLKDLSIQTPVIFMTGHGNELIASQAMKLGAYDYVIKDTKLVYLDRIPAVIREAKAKHDLLETNRFLLQELKKANDRLERLSHTDEMTGVANYRYLKSQLESELRRTQRFESSFSLCLLDVDHFKQINDRFGHPAGDAALQRVAQLLTESVRNVDTVGRYAGDEFLILFPGTHLTDAVALCERIRKRLESERLLFQGESIQLSVSIGVVDYHPQKRSTIADLITAADKALYLAKKIGRNRVETASLRAAEKTNSTRDTDRATDSMTA